MARLENEGKPYMQWLFVQYINAQHLQVKFINKLQHKMCVFLHIQHLALLPYHIRRLKDK